MPKVHYFKGYEFFFYSNEENEPMHIHVGKAEGIGKIWLEPEVEVNYFYDFTPKEKRELMEIVHEHLELFKKSWNEYFK